MSLGSKLAQQSAAKVFDGRIPVASDLRVRRFSPVLEAAPDSEVRRYTFAAD